MLSQITEDLIPCGFGLKPMKRNWMHLSLTAETAKLINFKRTSKPVILKIDAEKALKKV